MSLDINELVRLVKQAAVDAVRADAPMGQCYGIVISTSPLKIQVDQKKTLEAPQLILTDSVRDYNVVLSNTSIQIEQSNPELSLSKTTT